MIRSARSLSRSYSRVAAQECSPRRKPWVEAEDHAIYVADVLNWRFQAFARTAPAEAMTKYIPSVRMFWGSVPSVGWSSQQTAIPFK
jgi:hypothetical protein